GVIAVLAVGCAALSDPSQHAATRDAAPTHAAADLPLNEPVEARVPATVQDQALATMLDKKLPEVSFDSVPFDDAVGFLSDLPGANIYVNWRALEAAGIARNIPVTARLRDVSFRKTLQIILTDVGGGTVKLGFEATD